jgi:hypothetical protein
MNPSSMKIEISAAQRQNDMKRNRPGDEFGEINKLSSRELFDDEG